MQFLGTLNDRLDALDCRMRAVDVRSVIRPQRTQPVTTTPVDLGALRLQEMSVTERFVSGARKPIAHEAEHAEQHNPDEYEHAEQLQGLPLHRAIGHPASAASA